MASCLINVTFNHEGEEWGNTWGVSVGATAQITQLDIESLGAVTALNADGTIAKGAVVSVINSILRFHEELLPPFVKITEVYLTDGVRRRAQGLLGTLNAFWVASVNAVGARNPNSSPDQYAPGSIVLQVNKNPAYYSVRRGRVFLRALLADTDVRFGGRGGVDWTSPARRDAISAVVQAAMTSSQLSEHFAGVISDNGNPSIGIPFYYGKLAPIASIGSLAGVRPIENLAVVGPVSRQMKKGRKRAA